ncbi:MAG TPA: FAD-binding oxidoreductase [Gallionellaceae bacterium]|nr:FAD-binding oxidoreductase [Gallionellaceae bacterium]
MTTSLIDALRQIVGNDNVLTGISAAPYYRDQRGNYSGSALAVVLPADTQQVSALVSLCMAHRIAVVPQGGNTSLCGASVPLAEADHSIFDQQVLINLSRMTGIRTFDAVNYTMTVEAGCTLSHIRDIAALHNRLFPLSLSAIESRCEIGGNLSTNAGGIGVLRYGNTRDLVLGLEVVLPDGRIWNGLRSLRKDNTGYDLKHLFIGAEGTLGIITAAVLKLYPRPLSQATACVALRDPAAAVALLAHLRATCGDRISAFEIIARPCLDIVLRHFPDTEEPFKQAHQWMVIIELSDVLEVPLEAALRKSLQGFKEGAIESLVTDNKTQAASWWNLRKYISDAQKAEGISIKHDISVPISNVPAFFELADAALRLEFPGVRIVAFGHIGDGNIHYNASMPDAIINAQFIARSAEVNRIVYDIVAQLDGSISAEHGLGQLKRGEIHHYKNALELELMCSIKHTLDPQGLMNPGKLF